MPWILQLFHAAWIILRCYHRFVVENVVDRYLNCDLLSLNLNDENVLLHADLLKVLLILDNHLPFIRIFNEIEAQVQIVSHRESSEFWLCFSIVAESFRSKK